MRIVWWQKKKLSVKIRPDYTACQKRVAALNVEIMHGILI